jgi:uncharacterized protein YbjT (DUF2867 family)
MPTASILLTGATVYIGGLLLPRLAAGGRRVRFLARRRERVRERFGVDVAYYLVRSMFRGMLRRIAAEGERERSV